MQLSEAFLKKLAMSGAVLGIFILYLYSGSISFDSVETLDTVRPDTEVKLSGEVLRVSQTEKVAFVQVANEVIDVSDVVVFKDRNLTLATGDKIEVIGTTELREGEMQLIANQILLLE